ncbi:hypothetical protein JQ615_12335 [Bradyrhizobium jicamae]|uniref:Uncharacterized protein n=1 Tax=Bradyrhizobium jicamae TaxID=280332 RepID=A0ABS5FHB1_9BRAD|nr:hypothetical protein [Bradyrhizobium jicamae]MBR0796177.1 hypothetical protein [Bradyrhizobium jicamae]MBR0937727.1 hypothetical protein [Bradyrhizobium jicamae]
MIIARILPQLTVSMDERRFRGPRRIIDQTVKEGEGKDHRSTDRRPRGGSHELDQGAVEFCNKRASVGMTRPGARGALIYCADYGSVYACDARHSDRRLEFVSIQHRVAMEPPATERKHR